MKKNGFPHILETIKIDRQLHFQLQYNGNSIPLPPWFTQGRDTKINRIFRHIFEMLPAQFHIVYWIK